MKRKIALIALLIACHSAGALYAKDWLWTPESGQWISEKDIEKRSARLQYEKARGLEEIGDVKGAVREYARLVRQYPASVYAPDAQYMIGILKEGEGDFYGAFKEYAKLINNYPSYKRFLEIVEREYRIGNLYLAGEKTSIAGMKILPGKDKAIEVFQHIVRSAPFSSFAPRAQFNIGEAYRSIKRYPEAIPEYQRLVNTYPESELVIEASYQIAACGYMRSQDAPYDQTATNIAMGAMKDFLKKYPRSRKAPDIRSKLNGLMTRKASKSYEIAQFYDKEGSDEAAIIYYQDVINEHPGSPIAVKAEKRIDELIVKPTSKKYEDKKTGTFLSKLKMPSVPMPAFLSKKSAKQEEAAATAPAAPAKEKASEKKVWEFWKKPQKAAAADKKETPAPAAQAAQKESKKKFWEVWKQEKKTAAGTEQKLGEEGTLKMKEAPEAVKQTPGETVLPLIQSTPVTVKKAAAKEPSDDEIDRELMEEKHPKVALEEDTPEAPAAPKTAEPASVPAEEPRKDIVTAQKTEQAAAEPEQTAAPAAVTEGPKIEPLAETPADAQPAAAVEPAAEKPAAAELPKELDVVQIVDLKLVETTKGSRMVVVLNKTADYSVYELKDPMRLMIAMKSQVYSKLDDRIEVNRSGIKTVRSHFRNKEETENGWQVNAIVIDFDRKVSYDVTSDDTSIVVDVK